MGLKVLPPHGVWVTEAKVYSHVWAFQQADDEGPQEAEAALQHFAEVKEHHETERDTEDGVADGRRSTDARLRRDVAVTWTRF